MRRRFNFTQHNSKALEEMCRCQHHLVPRLLPGSHASPSPLFFLLSFTFTPHLPPSLCLFFNAVFLALSPPSPFNVLFKRWQLGRRSDRRTGGDREVGNGSRQWGGTEEEMNNLWSCEQRCGKSSLTQNYFVSSSEIRSRR